MARISVDIVANSKGLNRGLRRADRALSRFERKAAAFGRAAGAGLVGVGAAAAGIGVQLARLDEQVENSLRVSTGASGAALRELELNARAVNSAVPQSLDQVADAIGGVSTRFSFVGEDLEKTSKRFLDFGRITGVDTAAAVNALSSSMAVFGEEGVGAVDEALGDVINISQKTGAEFGKLLSDIEEYGPVFRNIGLDLEQTMALFGQFSRAGVQVSAIGPAINVFGREMAKLGRDPLEAFREIIEAMQQAASDQEALTIAQDAFGSEGANRLTAGVRSGVIDLSALAELMGENAGLVDELGESTLTASDRLAILAGRATEFALPYVEAAVDEIERLIRVADEEGLAAAFEETLISIGDIPVVGAAAEAALRGMADAAETIFDHLEHAYEVLQREGWQAALDAFLTGPSQREERTDPEQGAPLGLLSAAGDAIGGLPGDLIDAAEEVVADLGESALGRLALAAGAGGVVYKTFKGARQRVLGRGGMLDVGKEFVSASGAGRTAREGLREALDKYALSKNLAEEAGREFTETGMRAAGHFSRSMLEGAEAAARGGAMTVEEVMADSGRLAQHYFDKAAGAAKEFPKLDDDMARAFAKASSAFQEHAAARSRFVKSIGKSLAKGGLATLPVEVGLSVGLDIYRESKWATMSPDERRQYDEKSAVTQGAASGGFFGLGFGPLGSLVGAGVGAVGGRLAYGLTKDDASYLRYEDPLSQLFADRGGYKDILDYNVDTEGLSTLAAGAKRAVALREGDFTKISYGDMDFLEARDLWADQIGQMFESVVNAEDARLPRRADLTTFAELPQEYYQQQREDADQRKRQTSLLLGLSDQQLGGILGIEDDSAASRRELVELARLSDQELRELRALEESNRGINAAVRGVTAAVNGLSEDEQTTAAEVQAGLADLYGTNVANHATSETIAANVGSLYDPTVRQADLLAEQLDELKGVHATLASGHAFGGHTGIGPAPAPVPAPGPPPSWSAPAPPRPVPVPVPPPPISGNPNVGPPQAAQTINIRMDVRADTETTGRKLLYEINQELRRGGKLAA